MWPLKHKGFTGSYIIPSLASKVQASAHVSDGPSMKLL